MIARENDTADKRRFTAGRVGALSVVAATFGFWIWAFSPWAPSDNPDRLDDRAFAEAAETRCAVALAQIAKIPSARTAESPGDRSEQVEAGTLAVEAMVADLRALAVEVESDVERDILGKWFTDWDRYLSDRWDHVERLRSAVEGTSDRDLAFVLSAAVGGGRYTERIDGFARVNDMESCLVPGDV